MGTKGNRVSKCIWSEVNIGMVVYFNNWFSSMYSVVEDIKREFKGVKVVFTSNNDSHVIRGLSDVNYKEPENILGYLGICKENKVDIFFCKENMVEVSKYKEQLDGMGIHTTCDTYSIMDLASSKSKVYEELRDTGICNIPRYRVIGSKIGIGDILASGVVDCFDAGIVCKLDSDEGGSSVVRYLAGKDYKPLGDNTKNLIDIKGKSIVMPYLGGPEISVDCYFSRNGDIAIVREKGKGRECYIQRDEYIEDVAIKIGKHLGIKVPYNVQLRYQREDNRGRLEDKLMLMDLNVRLSGGIYLSNLSGVNIPLIYIKDKMGIDYKIQRIKELTIGRVERGIIIK